MLKKVSGVLVGVAPLSVFAAPDLTAITTAQSDALAYAGAILAMMVAIWAAKIVYRKFFGG